jgi:hypothetical protein
LILHKKIKIFLILATLFLYLENILANEVLFKKNGIIITNNDIENYIKLHNDYHGNEIKNSTAIKNLYLIFKIVDKQIENNPNFIEFTNKIIDKDIQNYKKKYSAHIMSYFLRYEILKNDFISLHIDNNSLSVLDNLFNDEINLYSDSECKTINKVLSFKELKIRDKKFILTNISDESILIEEENYLCLSKENREFIYDLTNRILSEEGYKKFLEYVHKNIKK